MAMNAGYGSIEKSVMGMKVNELKEVCFHSYLRVGGRKSDLQDRILSALATGAVRVQEQIGVRNAGAAAQAS